MKDALMQGLENFDAANGTNHAEKFRQGAATQTPTESTTATPKADVASKSVADTQSKSTDIINITATNVTITAAKIVEEGATSDEAARDATTAVEASESEVSNRADLVNRSFSIDKNILDDFLYFCDTSKFKQYDILSQFIREGIEKYSK